MIKVTDIKQGISVQLSDGNVFYIDSIEECKGMQLVNSSLNGGAKGNYRTELNDAVLFFNENESVIIPN